MRNIRMGLFNRIVGLSKVGDQYSTTTSQGITSTFYGVIEQGTTVIVGSDGAQLYSIATVIHLPTSDADNITIGQVVTRNGKNYKVDAKELRGDGIMSI